MRIRLGKRPLLCTAIALGLASGCRHAHPEACKGAASCGTCAAGSSCAAGGTCASTCADGAHADAMSVSPSGPGTLFAEDIPPEAQPHQRPYRRTFADITANPAFGHAPDYSWLCGELQYQARTDVWRLRYAPVTEEDRYGGAVRIIPTGPMTAYRSGQIVRVEGYLQNSATELADPPYQVRYMQPVEGSQASGIKAASAQSLSR